MRALWIAVEAPHFSRGGASIRQAYLLAALARQVETHLIVVDALLDQRVRDVVATVNELGRTPRRQAGRNQMRVRALWHTLVNREPYEVTWNAGARRAIGGLLDQAPDFDVIHVEHLLLADLVRRRRGEHWALTLQQLPSRRIEQQLALTLAGRQRWILERELVKAKRAERRTMRDYDQVFVCSDADAAVLGGHPTVAPNGVDTVEFAPTPLPAAPRLVFTGSLVYLPNIDGMEWFCHQVLPRVRDAVPEVELDIVGIQPVARVLELGSLPGVSIHADVPRVQPFLERGRVAVVPLRMGSGTRLKALEAMAAGRPVVGTTIGLEGLDLVDGETAMIADDPSAMASAVVALLRDDERARPMAAAGRRLVEERYSWDRVGDSFVGQLLSAAGTRKAR